MTAHAVALGDSIASSFHRFAQLAVILMLFGYGATTPAGEAAFGSTAASVSAATSTERPALDSSDGHPTSDAPFMHSARAASLRLPPPGALSEPSPSGNVRVSSGPSADVPDLVCPPEARFSRGKHLPSVAAARADAAAALGAQAGSNRGANPATHTATAPQPSRVKGPGTHRKPNARVNPSARAWKDPDPKPSRSVDPHLALLFRPAALLLGVAGSTSGSTRAHSPVPGPGSPPGAGPDSTPSAGPGSTPGAGPGSPPGARPNAGAGQSPRPGLNSSPSQYPGIRRLAIWGDSHLATGVFVEELARRLAMEGVEVGTSFIPPYMSRRWVRLPLRAFCLSEGWSFKATYQSEVEIEAGPALGEMRSRADVVPVPLEGVIAQEGAAPIAGGIDQEGTTPMVREAERLQTSPFLSLDLRNEEKQSDVTGLRMLYRAAPEPLELALSVNHGPERRIRLDAATPPGAVVGLFLSPDGGGTVSTLMIRIVAGDFALLGFVVERETAAALTVDTLAFPGATVRGWAQVNPERLAALMGGAPYDAVMLEYGTNEAAGDFDASRYAETLHQALLKLRGVFPEVPCLLLGPPDRGGGERLLRADRVDRADRGSRTERALRMRHALIHKQVNAIQARIGARHGCRNWDWQQAMGGAGSAYRWVRTSPPRMARDLIHLTSEGYRHSAAALANRIGWGSGGDTGRVSVGGVTGRVTAGDPGSRSDRPPIIHRTVVGEGGG